MIGIGIIILPIILISILLLYIIINTCNVRRNQEIPIIDVLDINNKIKFRTITNNQDKYNQKNCVICLNNYSFGAEVKILKCGHLFHVDCIDKWLNIVNICPICKN
tara:strand:- start:489 stop:806 length:318 start_codon:yes stop_codon:yes gene_type:complete